MIYYVNKEKIMSKITVFEELLPLIIFDSDEWKNDDDYLEVASEIIEFIKEHDFEYILVQNKEYSFGDTESSPIILINTEEYGGIEGTLGDYIKDVINDLIPDYEG
jgi:hypothetical protein